MLLRRHCRITPFVHQANGLACMMERLERFGSFGLLHDMGCGKTLTVLGAFLALHEEGRADSMLVICPSSVVSAWTKESAGILKRGGVEIDVLALDHPSVKRRKRDLEEWLARRDLARRYGGVVLPGIVALNYEGTWRMGAELKAAGFDIDVCDESQRLKAPGSNQSLAMHKIGKAPSHVLQAMTGTAMLTPFRPTTAAPLRVIMTGTPVPEGGLDWYGQFRFLDDRVLGTNHTNFKREFAIEIDCGTFRKVVINPHTLPLLESRVMERVHRVSKEEAVDLPEQTHARIEFELDPKARRLYDELVRDSIAFVEAGAGNLDFLTQAASMDMGDESEILGDNVLTRMLRLQQITGGFMQVDGRDSVEPIYPDKNAKLSCLTDLMETLRDANAKLVVFHRFTHEGQAIIKAAERISGKNTPVSYINGQVKSSARGRMIDQFQEGDAWFFVGQIQACAEGITLHAASDGAFYSSPFASAVFQQALARYHRIGQTKPVTHHHLLGLDTIDETILDAQVEKKEVADEIVDGGWQRFLLRRGR